MRKNFMKKLGAFALAGAMAAGTAVSVAADSDRIDLVGGYADCSLDCYMSHADASTDLTYDDGADYTSVYVNLSFDIMQSGGGYEYGDYANDSDDDYASCSVNVTNPYNMGATASSSHSATIEDSCGSSYLSEDAY